MLVYFIEIERSRLYSIQSLGVRLKRSKNDNWKEGSKHKLGERPFQDKLCQNLQEISVGACEGHNSQGDYDARTGRDLELILQTKNSPINEANLINFREIRQTHKTRMIILLYC